MRNIGHSAWRNAGSTDWDWKSIIDAICELPLAATYIFPMCRSLCHRVGCPDLLSVGWESNMGMRLMVSSRRWDFSSKLPW